MRGEGGKPRTPNDEKKAMRAPGQGQLLTLSKTKVERGGRETSRTWERRRRKVGDVAREQPTPTPLQ